MRDAPNSRNTLQGGNVFFNFHHANIPVAFYSPDCLFGDAKAAAESAFEGDDPATPRSEGFDSPLPGSYDFLANSNLNSRPVRSIEQAYEQRSLAVGG